MHVAALAGYVVVALAFAWPLPLHLGTQLPGPVSQDTGVYVWNLWVFRHEIVQHHHLPFATLEIMSLASPVPLAMHNYTAIADILAFPLLPLIGTVRTFNVLIIASGVLSAYVMFLFARRVTGDAGASWLAGLLFGFSPFMSARTSEHFSLVQTAPLVICALLIDRFKTVRSIGLGVALGVTVAVAYLCDPYYAVYCLMMVGFAIVSSAIVVRDPDPARFPWRWVVIGSNAIIAGLAALVVWIAVSGGARVSVLGTPVSMTQLYTPVLALTVMTAVRIWLTLRARISWTWPAALPPVHVIAVSVVVCLLLVAPVVFPVGAPTGERHWISPKVFWRSSAAGLDLVTLLTPNPLHPWFGRWFQDWLARQPHTPIENVASIPWTAIAVVALAWWRSRASIPRYWVAFTAFFICVALGPFLHVGGQNLYVPTPWAILRYVPVVGAARMPTRLAAVVMFGVAVLLACAVRDLRTRVRQPALVLALVTALLVFEMTPAPRTTYSAAVPGIFNVVAADPRPLSVLTLPFGLRDGLVSYGNNSPTSQFFQTVHGKPIIGGYVSRLPSNDVIEYTNRRVTAALIQLSEGRTLTAQRRAAAVKRAHEVLPALNIGYVVVNHSRASDELIQFAKEAFDLQQVATEGERTLFRTPLAMPAVSARVPDKVPFLP